MRVAITGADGMLAQALASELSARDIAFEPLSRRHLDVTAPAAVDEVLTGLQPDVVLHCAAFTAVDDAEADEAAAHAVNAGGAANVARYCARNDVCLVYPSTDYVFDGSSSQPYPVSAEPHPLNAYGRSKLAGEIAARQAPRHLIVRTSWLYGPGGRNFVRTITDRLRAGAELRVVADQCGSPTFTHDVAKAIVDLLSVDAAPASYHVTNDGSTSWHGFAVEIARLLEIEAAIMPCATSDYPRPARRPAYSVLDCSGTSALIGPLRDWRVALANAIGTGAY
jgi:dTDP-4-dehydrorhamnose reductase